ncbi:hypothetical protein EVA_06955 [gut metagenome]|uniref:Uncharacterized protein n=1 Tax=gut metagenome TaxID=749906 RepID=J9GR05_9ZZZZ
MKRSPMFARINNFTRHHTVMGIQHTTRPAVLKKTFEIITR